MCCAADMLSVPSRKQVVLVGNKESTEFRDMVAAAFSTYDPNRTVSDELVDHKFYIRRSVSTVFTDLATLFVDLGDPNRPQEHRGNGILGEQQRHHRADGTEQPTGEASGGARLPGLQVQPSGDLCRRSPRAAQQDSGSCYFVCCCLKRLSLLRLWSSSGKYISNKSAEFLACRRFSFRVPKAF